ncbi:MAG: hypothetical protein KDH20_05540 [Rhodocyclaceae bacterium]|nr:hypothetical protein [Rhodocyclaceae bacterium]
MHHRPIRERIDWLLDHARSHSEAFSSAEAWLARRRYRAEHPTAMAALKCMDGRINLSLATNTPMGIIQPFRNLGGRFDLGWPHLGEVFSHYVQDVVHDGRRALVFITYHFSRGDPARGCAGFGYDTAAAREHAWAIRGQMQAVFGGGHDTVYPLVCGFETDSDAMILHAPDGRSLEVASLDAQAIDALPALLEAHFPDMPGQVRHDLLPVLLGNRSHARGLIGVDRELDIVHREWMICLGRGFDWLHVPNTALIVGPYSPDLSFPIGIAADLIRDNMAAGRIPDDGFLLLANVPYTEIGMDRARAELKSRFMARFAAKVIGTSHPDLAERMHMRTAVLDWRSRSLQQIDPEG